MSRPMPQCERCNLRSYQTIENECADLHARCNKIEREHHTLVKALTTISEGIEIVNCQPRMDGTFEQHPKLISGNRMKEIAQEALEEAK